MRSGEWGKANEVAADVATLLDEVSVLAQVDALTFVVSGVPNHVLQEIVVTDRTQQHLLQLAGGIMEVRTVLFFNQNKRCVSIEHRPLPLLPSQPRSSRKKSSMTA